MEFEAKLKSFCWLRCHDRLVIPALVSSNFVPSARADCKDLVPRQTEPEKGSLWLCKWNPSCVAVNAAFRSYINHHKSQKSPGCLAHSFGPVLQRNRAGTAFHTEPPEHPCSACLSWKVLKFGVFPCRVSPLKKSIDGIPPTSQQPKYFMSQST